MLGVLSMLFASCGGTSKTAKALRHYNTYAFLPSKDTIANRAYDNDQVQQTIIKAINDHMEQEDYRVDTLQPDVLVYVHVLFDEKADVNANPVYTNYSYYRPGLYIGAYYEPYVFEDYYTIQRLSGESIALVPYQQGNIVIDFIDRRTKEIIWRGTADREISNRRLQRDIRRYVGDIFKKFP